MMQKALRHLSILLLPVILLLSSCAFADNETDNGDALTLCAGNVYIRFQKLWDLLAETYPEIELDFISYTGSNATGYSWTQMQADDISDIFITSQILDKDLARERLVDLSGYPFIGALSNAVLNQVSIDGGIYLLPTDYSMYGIFYNKTLMEENNWQIPTDFAELEALCGKIQEAGLLPGIAGTMLTGDPFSAVFNLAKTDWLTTPEGINWERDFLAGDAAAEGRWEHRMDYVQRYIDIGMFHTDPEDRNDPTILLDYLGNRKAVFCTTVQTLNITELPDTGDKLGMMPFLSEDGSKNIYMYSPTCYIGLSKRLTEPGNEKKLEDAIKLLSLIYSPQGQAAFIDDLTPCVMSVLDSVSLSEDALIYDARQALGEGRAFMMTYAHWDNILTDIGQAYKDWFRGENGMDGPKCIARMDELCQAWLDSPEQLYFCESTADFTLAQTAELIGKALGAAAGADAAMIPLGEFHDGADSKSCVTGKLYAGKINVDTVATISPSNDGEYAVMTMTGAEAKALAEAGFDPEGNGNPFPYVLAGGETLQDNVNYKIAFLKGGYTRETADRYLAEIHPGSLRTILRVWLEEQRRVSPDQNTREQ